MKKLFFLALFILLIISILTGCSFGTAATEITIFHTNDTHGRIVGDGEYIIGIDTIAAIHKNTPDSILVDAGDAFHGLPIATVNGGADIAELMKAAGYTAMALGNHEFNYGWERLIELREIAEFPFLASNVTLNGADFLDDTYMIEVNRVKIGLFGITTETTSHSAMPGFVRGVTFSDPVLTAQTRAEYLRDNGAVIIIALCHLGDTPNGGTLSNELAEKVPEIDIIIDGHSHTELPYGLNVNEVLIAQTGDHGSNLGKVTVFVEKGKIISKIAEFVTVEEAMEVTPDETVAAMLSAVQAGLDVVLNEPLGESLTAMSSERSPGVRTQEMPLGSLVADAYRDAAHADIAIVNGGDIRADLPAGVVTKGDVISVLPFGNTLMVKNVTPAVLYKVLENGVSGIIADYDLVIDHEQSAQGRFLNVSGFSFVYDPSAPVGMRVVSVTLDDGRELYADDNSTEFSLASSNYLMTGGDEYYMLADLPVLHELGSADEALKDYISRYSPVDNPPEGRILTLADYSGSRGNTVSLYTSMKDSLIRALVDAFEAKHGDITVETRIAGAGTLMAEITEELEQGEIRADVIWTSEIPDFYGMKDDGLLLQYTPEGANAISNPLTDSDGYFYPARLGTMGIAYNTDLVSNPPEAWNDLLGSDFTGGFAIADPTTSGTAMMSVVLLDHEFGEEFFKNLRDNGAFIGQGSSQVVDSVAEGDLVACLAVDYIAFDKIDSGAPMALVYPEEMLVIPSPVAIFESSSAIDSAKLFVDFLLSEEAQQIIASIGTLPVLDVKPLTDSNRSLPNVSDAISRAIELRDSDMMRIKFDVLATFIAIMND
ncbi:MAG: extracellular solute-binding protein [Oscillospiraceae bacterium]|nr:extracellular solute-binding protein [Oscillospiraceae bacterium]